MARGKLARFSARSERIGRRMRLPRRTRPDRDGAELVMAALPAKGLRLGPRLQHQLHGFGGALARLGRVQAIAQILAGGPTQHPDHQAARRQIVEHRQVFGHLHRVALRDDRAEHGDGYLRRGRHHMRGRDNGRRRQAMRRIMMLGQADPVEAELLDEPNPLDHAAISLRPSFAVISVGRHRPGPRHGARRMIARGFEIGDFHRGDRPALTGRERAAAPLCQTSRASASGGRCRWRRGSETPNRARRRQPRRGSA